MTQVLDIFQEEDGFYVGRKLKNGKLANGAYKMKGEDIMTMFTKFFSDYCDDTHKNQLLMQDGDGRLLVTTRVGVKKEDKD